ncbi:hypothetical protein P5673_019364 [Acropora cervicornis]|uniref:Uncharacterized protein n=1 Tax=Acropora cervicornis TaxID=6130 RepID=A0AAD9V218_ACRCE|nr:hypothetical protein P5673_019364 [Acropora cervicornis]
MTTHTKENAKRDLSEAVKVKMKHTQMRCRFLKHLEGNMKDDGMNREFLAPEFISAITPRSESHIPICRNSLHFHDSDSSFHEHV